MCGICGIIFSESSDQYVDQKMLKKMADTLIHRGPDQEGFYISPDHKSGLAFRRLSIIDLLTGDQPLCNEDGSLWIVFNGEIYNFQSLRQELEGLGHVFRTNSDTEVILHAYEAFGEKCVERFRGMFAFAIWDSIHSTIFLGRDRVGKKPLFYAITKDGFYFASELKAIIRLGVVSKEIDLEALQLYLAFGHIPAPWSILKQVRKVPPAHTLRLDISSGEIHLSKYWEPHYSPKIDLSPLEIEAQFLDRLREAVRLRMISDVPIGALLSGGIDSSLVVALMAEQSSQKVRTFTIGFDEGGFDERPYARQVAEKYGTEHHEYLVKGSASNILPKIAWFLDEPLADSSALPSYYVAQMARQEVTVVLNGDGGDENFGGYWHQGAVLDAIWFSNLPAFLRNDIIHPLAHGIHQVSRVHFFQRLDSLTEQANWPVWALHERRMGLFRKETLPEMLKARADNPGSSELMHFQNLYQGAENENIVDQILCADLLGFLPGQLLVKMDRMTMANSLEARSPFLDQEVIEFSARLPITYKFDSRKKKKLLRRIAEKYLPESLINRPKMGFAIPVGRWFTQDLGQQALQLLGHPNAKLYEYLEFEKVQPILTAAMNGDSASSFRIWALMILELWLKEFM